MPTSDELLAGGIPGGDEDDAERFLGVPKGYAAERQLPRPVGPGGPQPTGIARPGMGTPGAVSPLYKEGDQHRPGGRAPEFVAQLQIALDSAGLYPKGANYSLGSWREPDITAYTKLLKWANQQGYTDAEALQVMGTLTDEQRDEAGLGKVGTGGGGRATAEKMVSLSHPDDLRALANRTAKSVLGRSMTSEELDRFIAAYHGAERTEATTGAAAPSADILAESQLRQANPEESFGNDLLTTYDRALKLMGVGG